MGGNLQSISCDCFEKDSKKIQAKNCINNSDITISPTGKAKTDKKARFAKGLKTTTDLAQKIMAAQDAVLIHTSSKKPNKNISLQSFSVIRLLGKGASGKVLLVKKTDTIAQLNYRLYAMKIIKKADIVKHDLADHIKLEKHILQTNKNRFLVKLKYAFQTPNNIYLVMEFMSGGDLHQLLKKFRNFPEGLAQFYSAEILLALEYLHETMHVIYRDLKPENILLDGQGHIKLADFGLSKKIIDKTNTFAGTPEYIAPEILLSVGHSYSVDYWSLGVVLYEMLAGKPPFSSYDGNFTTIVKLILDNKPFYPIYFSSEATDLISKLLKSHPKQRLGSNGIAEIKNHPYFKKINWELLNLGKLNPPLSVEEEVDVSAQEIPSKIQESAPSQHFINLSRITYNQDITMDDKSIDKSIDKSMVKSQDRSFLKSDLGKPQVMQNK